MIRHSSIYTTWSKHKTCILKLEWWKHYEKEVLYDCISIQNHIVKIHCLLIYWRNIMTYGMLKTCWFRQRYKCFWRNQQRGNLILIRILDPPPRNGMQPPVWRWKFPENWQRSRGLGRQTSVTPQLTTREALVSDLDKSCKNHPRIYTFKHSFVSPLKIREDYQIAHKISVIRQINQNRFDSKINIEHFFLKTTK